MKPSIKATNDEPSHLIVGIEGLRRSTSQKKTIHCCCSIVSADTVAGDRARQRQPGSLRQCSTCEEITSLRSLRNNDMWQECYVKSTIITRRRDFIVKWRTLAFWTLQKIVVGDGDSFVTRQSNVALFPTKTHASNKRFKCFYTMKKSGVDSARFTTK